jgi:hypothetical protein
VSGKSGAFVQYMVAGLVLPQGGPTMDRGIQVREVHVVCTDRGVGRRSPSVERSRIIITEDDVHSSAVMAVSRRSTY